MATAITEAPRYSGTYKLFFMVRLENGRVVTDIETVMSCIDMNFFIIINNVKKKQFSEIMKRDHAYQEIVTISNAGEYTTPQIEFIPSIQELDEVDNALTKLSRHATNFIRRHAPTAVIEPRM